MVKLLSECTSGVPPVIFSKIIPFLQQEAEEVNFSSPNSVLNHAAMFIDRMFAYLGKAFYQRKRLDLCFKISPSLGSQSPETLGGQGEQ